MLNELQEMRKSMIQLAIDANQLNTKQLKHVIDELSVHTNIEKKDGTLIVEQIRRVATVLGLQVFLEKQKDYSTLMLSGTHFVLDIEVGASCIQKLAMFFVDQGSEQPVGHINIDKNLLESLTNDVSLTRFSLILKDVARVDQISKEKNMFCKLLQLESDIMKKTGLLTSWNSLSFCVEVSSSPSFSVTFSIENDNEFTATPSPCIVFAENVAYANIVSLKEHFKSLPSFNFNFSSQPVCQCERVLFSDINIAFDLITKIKARISWYDALFQLKEFGSRLYVDPSKIELFLPFSFGFVRVAYIDGNCSSIKEIRGHVSSDNFTLLQSVHNLSPKASALHIIDHYSEH